jgi:hypothetical protein
LQAAGKNFASASSCQTRAKVGSVPAIAGGSAGQSTVNCRDRFEALIGRLLRECPHCCTGVMLVIDSIAQFAS